MEIIHEAPKAESFTPLAVYQSQTPESFFSGPPVLYHHSPSATLSIHKSDLECAPVLSRLAEGAQKTSNGTSGAVNGSTHNEEEEDEELSIPNIDISVTSERLTLYSPSLTTGLSIPYPSITLHAIQPPSPPTHPSPSLFLQLLTEAQTFDDHDPDSTISLTLIPAPEPPPPPPASSTTEEDGDDEAAPRDAETEPHPTQALYTALSACANLHPDPLSSDDGADEIDGDEHQQRQQPAIMFEGDDGEGDVSGVYPIDSGRGLPPAMPGSGGWITAENVGEFFDEEGNWRGRGGGAGTVRGREEGEEGEEGDGEETKWRRTE